MSAIKKMSPVFSLSLSLSSKLRKNKIPRKKYFILPLCLKKINCLCLPWADEMQQTKLRATRYITILKESVDIRFEINNTTMA